MNELEIYPMFRDLLPPLVGAELEHLEKSVLEDGIREPLIIWNGKLVDGHHRYEFAQNYDLPFEVVEKEFIDEDAVCEWMIVNQLGRRNLEPQNKTLYIGQLLTLRKKRVGNPKAFETPVNPNVVTVTTLDETPIRTQEKIAEEVGVSPKTVQRAGDTFQAYEKAEPELKEKFKKDTICP